VVLWNDAELDDDGCNQLHQQADYEQKNGQEDGCHANCTAAETRLDLRILIGVSLLASVGSRRGQMDYIVNDLAVSSGGGW